MSPRPLSKNALYTRCRTSELPFRTTADLTPHVGVLGQERAVEALHFGTRIKRDGYNLFVHGAQGTGRHTTVREYLERAAQDQPVPNDWCVLNNFEDAQKPLAVELPPGRGSELREDMTNLIEELKTAIPAAFDSEDYRARRQAIDEEFKEKQEHAFEELAEKAKKKSVALVRTPVGLAVAPMKDGEVISPEVFQRLKAEERQQFESEIESLQQELQATVRQIPEWDKDRRNQIRDLNRDVSAFAVGHMIEALKERYGEFSRIVSYLEAVLSDITDNVDVFLADHQAQMQAQTGQPGMPGNPLPQLQASMAFRRYEINLLVDNSSNGGAPVIYEDNPTFANLIGRVEHIAEMGALVTDFGLIRSGALHRANGGYLIVDAVKLLTQPYAYEGLKRALDSRMVRIESLGQALSLVSTVSLEPEPIPLDVKVILTGEPRIYYLLSNLDPEFNDLFKVSVDYGGDMDRSETGTLAYARLIAALASKEELRAFDRRAVARLIEHSARISDDSEKLSLRMGRVTDVMREADFWAAENQRNVVSPADVQQAIDTRVRRADRLRERSQEQITRGTVLIDTEGAQVGQINGLAVISLGEFSFGRPGRITARVRMGRGQVLDIEREVELGGPLHSKGVLILSGFLSARYALDRPLSLSASLVFEQSYGGIDGDSASSAELYALLSALSGLPLEQSLAVTGSVNQKGEVQAIGGVNEKIEGFFDICQERGLTGNQGVLIPASNTKHLMLRHDVVDACASGKFRVFPVSTIDEGMEILMGRRAGTRGKNGRFGANTINRLVEDRLRALADDLREFSRGGRENNQ
ncbi:MAG: ATP-dependent protease [Alphaproteobacteria bacterium]|nr:ATP-dependent protease [Alphaproteobacteria bacterium]